MRDDESIQVDRLLAEIKGLRARVEELERVQTSHRAESPDSFRQSPGPGAFRRRLRARNWMAAFAGLVAAPMVAWAVDVPFTFVNGTLADASQVNANFAALEQAFDAHVADTTIHHPQLTSINGLTGGTITGNVTVTGKVNVTTVEGTPLRLVSPTTIEVVGGTTASMTSAAQIQIQSALVRIN